MSDCIRCPICDNIYQVGGYENWGTCPKCNTNNDVLNPEPNQMPTLVSYKELEKQETDKRLNRSKISIPMEFGDASIIAYYDNNGTISYVSDKDGKPLRISLSIEGRGYTIGHSNFMLSMETCDGRYVLVESVGVHIPYRLWVKQNKEDIQN